MHIPGVIAHLFSEVTCCYALHDKQHKGATGHITHPHQDHATDPGAIIKIDPPSEAQPDNTGEWPHTYFMM